METSHEGDTITPKVYCLDSIPFWPPGTKLASISVVDTRPISDQLPIDIPFSERQPNGCRWIETLPLRMDYYCLEDEVDKFTQYFIEHGCYTDVKFFTKENPKYTVIWNNPTFNDALISLIQNGKSEGQLVYHQKSLNENTGELNTTNTQQIIRDFDAYYNFKNVSRIITILHNPSINHEYNPSIFTKNNPLILNQWVETLLVAEDEDKPVSYTGILYPITIKDKLVANVF